MDFRELRRRLNQNRQKKNQWGKPEKSEPKQAGPGSASPRPECPSLEENKVDALERKTPFQGVDRSGSATSHSDSGNLKELAASFPRRHSSAKTIPTTKAVKDAWSCSPAKFPQLGFGKNSTESTEEKPKDIANSKFELQREGDLWVARESISPLNCANDRFTNMFDPNFYWQDLASSQKLLFFDLETTGLSHQDLLFMAGFAYWQGQELIIEQLIASDRAEEYSMLERAAELFEGRTQLVTYNGRSFDWPRIRSRWHFHRIDREQQTAEIEVVDLLYSARRRYKKLLENCKLGTLETEVLNKQRHGQDIPGSEVPLRFEDYCQSGRLDLLDPIIYHNRIDLTSMVELYALWF